MLLRPQRDHGGEVSKHLDPSVVADVKKRLRALEPRGRFITAREAVAELKPEIQQAMARGYTFDAIAEQISKDMAISPNTLKAYLYAKAEKPAAPPRKKTPLRRSA
jgi:hypothetical protein